jgi:hypothetical protein
LYKLYQNTKALSKKPKIQFTFISSFFDVGFLINIFFGSNEAIAKKNTFSSILFCFVIRDDFDVVVDDDDGDDEIRLSS